MLGARRDADIDLGLMVVSAVTNIMPRVAFKDSNSMGDRGRPTVLTAEVRVKLLGYITDGLSIENACDLAGIHKSTFFEAQERARAHPKKDPELTDFFDRELPKARLARRAIAQAILTDSLRPDVPEETRRNMAFRILLLDVKMEMVRLKRLELEQGTKVEHSGSVGITPERRAWLDELRKDPEAVRLAVELGSRMQPHRLAAMGLKPNHRGSAPGPASGGAVAN